MPALVLRQDLQPRSDCETKQRNEGILESDAIDVVVRCAMREYSHPVVATEEPIENGRVDLCAGRDRLRRSGPSGLGRRFDVVANEPLAEPSWGDVLNHGVWATHQRIRNRSKVHLVRVVQVFKALADAPLAWTWLPVKLVWSERLRQSGRARVGGVELGRQTETPGGRCFVNVRGHVPQ